MVTRIVVGDTRFWVIRGGHAFLGDDSSFAVTLLRVFKPLCAMFECRVQRRVKHVFSLAVCRMAELLLDKAFAGAKKQKIGLVLVQRPTKTDPELATDKNTAEETYAKLKFHLGWWPADPLTQMLVMDPHKVTRAVYPFVINELDRIACQQTGHDRFADLPPMLMGHDASTHEFVMDSGIGALRQTGEYQAAVNGLAVDPTHHEKAPSLSYDGVRFLKNHFFPFDAPRKFPITLPVRIEDGIGRLESIKKDVDDQLTFWKGISAAGAGMERRQWKSWLPIGCLKLLAGHEMFTALVWATFEAITSGTVMKFVSIWRQIIVCIHVGQAEHDELWDVRSRQDIHALEKSCGPTALNLIDSTAMTMQSKVARSEETTTESLRLHYEKVTFACADNDLSSPRVMTAVRPLVEDFGANVSARSKQNNETIRALSIEFGRKAFNEVWKLDAVRLFCPSPAYIGRVLSHFQSAFRRGDFTPDKIAVCSLRNKKQKDANKKDVWVPGHVVGIVCIIELVDWCFETKFPGAHKELRTNYSTYAGFSAVHPSEKEATVAQANGTVLTANSAFLGCLETNSDKVSERFCKALYMKQLDGTIKSAVMALNVKIPTADQLIHSEPFKTWLQEMDDAIKVDSKKHTPLLDQGKMAAAELEKSKVQQDASKQEEGGDDDAVESPQAAKMKIIAKSSVLRSSSSFFGKLEYGKTDSQLSTAMRNADPSISWEGTFPKRMRIRTACAESGKENELFPWFNQCLFDAEAEAIVRAVCQDCKTAGDIAIVNAGHWASTCASVRKMMEDDGLKVRQLTVVTRARPVKRKRGAFCSMSVKNILLGNRVKALFHLPTRDTLEGSQNSYSNVLLDQPAFDPRTKQQLSASYKQKLLPHHTTMMMWPINGVPTGTTKKKAKLAKCVKGLNPVIWGGLEQETWQELFHLTNAFKVNAYNDTGGVQAEACQRLGVAYCGLVYNDDHLAFVAKHLDERVVPQCMMKEKHTHYQGTEMLAVLKMHFTFPEHADDPKKVKAGDADKDNGSDSDSCPPSDMEDIC